jgi:hypothetical protein
MGPTDPLFCEVHGRPHPVRSMVDWCLGKATEPEWGAVVAADETGRSEFPEPFTTRRPA